MHTERCATGDKSFWYKEESEFKLWWSFDHIKKFVLKSSFCDSNSSSQINNNSLNYNEGENAFQ